MRINPILPSEVLQAFVLMTPHLFHTNFGVFPLDQITHVGVSPSRYTLTYSAVKLFSKYSNLCEKHT